MKTMQLTWFVGLAACAAAWAAEKEPLFPEPEDVDVVLRQDALTEYRLLSRELRTYNRPRNARDIQGNFAVPNFQPPADQVVDAQALIRDADRDAADVVLRRTQALYADLLPALKDDAAFAALGDALGACARDAAATSAADKDARYALFERIVRLRRKIAFSNPLLAPVKRLLFIGREVPPPDELTWGTHMCDQYFGFHATLKGSTYGNGIYALERPFSDSPVLKNLVPPGTKIASESPYWNGRAITPEGGFLSPDVSWDGEEILFSWTPGEYRIREWDEKTCFHVMRMKADGSNLRMVTWGPYNDLFPRWLPNGRVLFSSERRGGFGRCHMRAVPNYTLHSMFPDGSDLVCLSPHETNEWEPSVDNSGMVVYTRWDYTDRGFNQAHHAWITYPDGRDPRELNGNTRTKERVAPHMEQNVRAIPGSRKYVAVAVGHHTPSVGSLVVIDPSVPDDDAMAQVKRLTPEVLLPEAEKMIRWPIRPTGCYGTPWPLSEKYYLCTWDGMGNGQFSTTIDYQRRKYALTLLDVFGNKIRIYAHPTISCQYPMPLGPRARPPVIPHKTLFGRPADADGRRPAVVPESELPQTAAYGLINVYNSRTPFPEGVKIAALRVWQVFPKVHPLVGHPRLGVVDQMPGRQCLGTVPVEADGSAHFEVPVKTPVYFQALDENGCAVQTMRTVAYAQAGERLTCNGCHESRHGRVSAPDAAPLAFRRAPSALAPEPDGSRPFNYPRLVQGVLDAKCASCHGEKRNPATMPDLRAGDVYLNPFCFNTSFLELVGRGMVHYYTAWYAGTNWWSVGPQRDRFVTAASEPGKVGARASKLYALLKKGHHGVKLSPEEMRRLVVWMDAQGAYLSHDTDALAQCEGQVVEGVAFPDCPEACAPVVRDVELLVVGDSLTAASAVKAMEGHPWGGRHETSVVVPGTLSAESRAVYAKCRNIKIWENAALVKIVRGRKGWVSGVTFRTPDGKVQTALAQATFDATGDGRVCRETGAEMRDGHFLPGPDWTYPYKPAGSENVIVADATAAVPRREVPELLKPENQRRLGVVLGEELCHLTKATNASFIPNGR